MAFRINCCSNRALSAGSLAVSSSSSLRMRSMAKQKERALIYIYIVIQVMNAYLHHFPFSNYLYEMIPHTLNELNCSMY